MFEDLPSFSMCSFFYVSYDCFYRKGKHFDKRFLLPSTSELLGEEQFADLYLAWDENNLFVKSDVHVAFDSTKTTEEKKKNCVELFFDTRDLKTRQMTRFCHHFIICPEEIGGYRAREITRFRGEDFHRLCDPKDLEVKTEIKKDSYTIEIVFSRECLYGFDPSRFDRFGFTYRINRSGGTSQNFTAVSEDFPIEYHPTFWCRMFMKGKKL